MANVVFSLRRSLACVILAVLLSACGTSLDDPTTSGAANGAASGAGAGAPSPAVHQVTTKAADQPTGVVLRQLLQEQARLWSVSDRILTAGADVCRERTRASFGFVAWTRWDIDRRYRIASMGVYGLDDRLRVVHVLPGSPAHAAGLRAGDVIERIGRHDMPSGKAAGAALGLVLQRETRAGVAQSFRVRRGDRRMSFDMVPRRQCAIDLIVTESERINAFAHGRSIYLTDGLMRVLSDDRELAAVTAHFIGHALFRHRTVKEDESVADKLTTQLESFMTAALDQDAWDEMKKSGSLPSAQAYSVMQEVEADRAALELLARADYPMDALVGVWQRLAETEGDGVLLDDFHPPSQERRAAVRHLLDQLSSQSGSGNLAPGS